jgi:glutamate-ammonia-ligase adenylyltransferase
VNRGELSLALSLKPRLKPAGVVVTRQNVASLLEAAAEVGLEQELREAIAPDGVERFLSAVFIHSPFLRDLMIQEPKRLITLLSSTPTARRKAIMDRVRRSWKNGDEARLMRALRRARQEMALLTALADLGGLWDLETVTGSLASFADTAVTATCRFLLRDAAQSGKIRLADPNRPDWQSGWIVLAMGKHGAGELNYSSDIDLIVLYDEAVARMVGDHEIAKVFIDLTKRLAALLQEHTEDGYAFRTDLRLRPDPGATNVALSTEAALQYYESFGQNWERAAMIKARPAAGDIVAGDAFLAELRPFIWRRYLDFASIADIHSIKRQIHDHRGHSDIAVAGHNVKLGRGGIREIEFFVQTQQLIAGGRHQELRGRETVKMLGALAEGGWITAATGRDMVKAYRHLRTVEHCIQMVADEQTHQLPEDEEELAGIARMVGDSGVASFAKRLRRTLEIVRGHYGALFEAATPLTSELGSLVFTGESDDPETLETLTRLGFQHPSGVIAAVRGWHFGRYPATRSASARERMTEFVPLLLTSLADAEDADAALRSFDDFLARMPAGVQLFSLLQTNRDLLNLLSMILGSAPRLAETIVHRAHVLDALTEPAFFGRLPDRALLAERLDSALAGDDTFEGFLDGARIFAKEQSFLIGVRVLAGTANVRKAAYAYSDLADLLVARVFARVQQQFEEAHGKMRGGRVVLLALGRLGGREMTAASDLDVIMLYDYSDKAEQSSGARPLPAVQYFGRLTQRLVSALSAPTAEGKLYEVDFRLRPSGNSGPLATHIDAFHAYQQRGAWTWEHMALTRARPIAGDKRLMKRASEEIQAVLLQRRKRKKITADVVEMRGIVEDAKGGEGVWDLKQAPGGLVDVEFIAQSLQLIHGARRPEILSTETAAVLEAAGRARLLTAGQATLLLNALHLYQGQVQILRLCLDEKFDPETADRALLARLARAGELPDFIRLDAHLRETQNAVRALFERLLGSPSSTDQDT